MCLCAVVVTVCQEEQLRDVIFLSNGRILNATLSLTFHTFVLLILSPIYQNIDVQIATSYISQVLNCSIEKRDSSVGIPKTVRAKFESWY